MAITVTPEITGQQADENSSLAYLYEPLRVLITDSNTGAKKIYIDVSEYDSSSDNLVNFYENYAVFELNTAKTLKVDIMAIIRQLVEKAVWKYSNVDALVSGDGYKAIIPQYTYDFTVRDGVGSSVDIIKQPIIGGRTFYQFQKNPSLLPSSPTNEFEYSGLDIQETDKLFAMSFVTVDFPNLVNQGQPNGRPTLTKMTPSNTYATRVPCAGGLLWKSRLGGWMHWGFDLIEEKNTSRVNGKLNVGLFEGDSLGNPFVENDFTEIQNSYSITLKSLSVEKKYLECLAGIKNSMAVYYQRPNEENLELMRLSSASASLKNLSNGGDFSVTLNSISKSSFLTR